MRHFDPTKCQPSPDFGAFGEDLSLAALRERIGSAGLNSDVYYYVVATVKFVQGRFRQEGSAPNFQGGRLSLCTCKHQMRTLKQPAAWVNSWVAGFTGIHEGERGQNALFFLMQVERAYSSFRELWLKSGLNPSVLAAKSSKTSLFGDFYEPQSEICPEFSSCSYHAPADGHQHRKPDHSDLWRNDIDYRNSRTHRCPSLLLGKQDASFIWNHPRLVWPKGRPEGKQKGIGRNHRHSPLEAFLGQLKEVL